MFLAFLIGMLNTGKAFHAFAWYGLRKQYVKPFPLPLRKGAGGSVKKKKKGGQRVSSWDVIFKLPFGGFGGRKKRIARHYVPRVPL